MTETNTAANSQTTPQPMKVYELAKELGLDSITLIDKLKRLDIDVKSHMSSIGSEEVKTVREAIHKEQAQLSKAAKSTKRKKEESPTQKRVGGTVIRRRTKTAAEEQLEAEQAAAAAAAAEEAAAAAEAQSAAAEVQEEAPAPAPEIVEAAPVQTVETKTVETAAPEATAPAATKAPAKKEEIKTTTAPKVIIKPAAPATPAAPAPLKGSGLKMHSLLGARNAGQTVKSTSILNIIKEEPIKKAPPRITPVSPLNRATPGIVNLGKDAIARLVEEEQSFKKRAGAKVEKEKDPLDVKITDYRAKKELIFLPKKKKLPIGKEIKRTTITTPAQHKRVVKIENTVTVAELAARMGIKSSEIIKKLMAMGMMVTMNNQLDLDTATLLATEYHFEIENVATKEEDFIAKETDAEETLQHRPPIVTVMGHVDHGKTSLLDAIRSADVAKGEAGGITQHIGAYTVKVEGKEVTFIDTPGHEAFTVMRARGANVTDIVVLVVAADDGVMPQTREAVDHARAANVPIIVAVNKIDKPGANPDKVLKGLSELGLLSEAWGGENIFVNVSAIKKTGIKELLEAILLQAEILDLKANPDHFAEGNVLEAKLDRNRGPVVDILVKRGTLRTGDSIVAGQFCGKVRALTDDKGKQLKEVKPGFAAQLLGLEGVPMAGEPFNVLENEAEVRKLADYRIQKSKAQDGPKAKMTLEQLFSKVEQGQVKELPVLLKTDVFGSTEAIKDSLSKIATEKVKVKVLSAATGGVTESDVMLAAASNAIILGFNVRPDTKARALAEAEGVEVKSYSIIYELLADVKDAMAGLLDKKAIEKYMGRAEVREIFTVPKIGVIAGCSVIDGKVARNCQVRLLRDNRIIFTGKLSSLRRFKDDAKEVATGYECGIGIENYNDLKPGDVIEAFLVEMVTQDIGTAVSTSNAKNTESTSGARV